MTDCSALPTQEEAELFKQDAGTINEVVTKQEALTDPASDGLPKTTIFGYNAKIDDAINRLLGVDKGNYEDDVLLENLGDYAVFQRGVNPTYWKIVDGVPLPYQVDYSTYTDPSQDVNLSQFNDVNSQTLPNFTAYIFDSVANMEAGIAIGGDSVSFGINQSLFIFGTDSRGNADTVQSFVTDSSGDIDLGGGVFARPLQSQTERLRVGDGISPTGTWDRDAVLVARNLTGLTDTHAFTDFTVISDVTDGGTYGAFDVKTEVIGTHLQDHVYSFQDRIQSSVDNLAKTVGLYSRPELNAGNIGTRKAIDVFDPVGGGNLSQNYGLFVRELLFGNTINQAVRTEGITPSSFGGVMAIGSNDSTTNIGPDFSVQLKIGGQQLTGSATVGMFANHTIQQSNSGSYYGVQISPVISDGASLGLYASFRSTDASLVGSGAVGECYGAILNDMASGTSKNFALLSLVTDGVGKKNIAVGGTAPNSYAGNSYFGGSTSVIPTAKAHCGPSSATAGTAGLKLTQGTLMTTPEDGAFEFDGTNLYFTVNGVRRLVNLT